MEETVYINCVNVSYYKHVIDWIRDTENVLIQEYRKLCTCEC